MSQLRFDPSRQLVTAQCTGALVLAKLGHLDGLPAGTDLATKPWVIEAGVQVLEQPFFARGNIATAGGCLASQYLATFILARIAGRDVAAAALSRVTPVAEQAAGKAAPSRCSIRISDRCEEGSVPPGCARTVLGPGRAARGASRTCKPTPFEQEARSAA